MTEAERNAEAARRLVELYNEGTVNWVSEGQVVEQIDYPILLSDAQASA